MYTYTHTYITHQDFSLENSVNVPERNFQTYYQSSTCDERTKKRMEKHEEISTINCINYEKNTLTEMPVTGTRVEMINQLRAYRASNYHESYPSNVYDPATECPQHLKLSSSQ